MKTISLDHPVRVYFKDGECYHDSATIMIANGFPSFIRARDPDVIYPWENVKHVTRAAKEPAADITKRMRASIAAIADERNGAKQETHRLRAEVERLQSIHTEHFLALRAALGLRDDEATDTVTGDFKALCERVSSQRKSCELVYRTACINSDDARRLSKTINRLQRDLTSVTEQRDVLKRQLEELRADLASQHPNRDKPPPGFDVSRLPKNLRMTVETAGVWGPNALAEAWRIHEEARKPVLSQPKQAEPGGPIWVRVVDTNSKHFGLVGRLEGIEFDSKCGDEMWSVDLGGIANARWKANVFAVVGTGRQGPGPNEAPKPDTEHQQAQNRDKWRATCLANGAKDCTVYFGPGDEVTFVVEMSTGRPLMDVMGALWSQHKMRSGENYTIREVRPIVDGVKPSAFKHPADNGQP